MKPHLWVHRPEWELCVGWSLVRGGLVRVLVGLVALVEVLFVAVSPWKSGQGWTASPRRAHLQSGPLYWRLVWLRRKAKKRFFER